MKTFICENITEKDGHLHFAGQDVTSLAKEYGTPLYLMDEERIRSNCRTYKEAFARYFPAGSMPLYASKACSFKQIYRIMQEENMGIDVVSAGEIATAVSAGFDMSKAYFHGNNKTDEDIGFAMDAGVGHFVSDNIEEIRSIERIAAERGITQRILLRVTPGIDPHTYEAVNTGMVDSKFGAAIETGQAMELVDFILKQEHIALSGFHCHVGSQVFGEDVFERAACVMLEFIARARDRFGFITGQLNLGGGYGVRYTDDDPYCDICGNISRVADVVTSVCEGYGMEAPDVFMEPGRSIVADAGMTVYTVGSVKDIPGYKKYVSIDGGMTDNPRFALYGSHYTCYAAGKMDEECPEVYTVAGRCCESGDIIQKDVPLPADMKRGDILAVATTGAYNYSMASNYNRIPRPPVVMLKNGSSYIAVRRETFDDITGLDV